MKVLREEKEGKIEFCQIDTECIWVQKAFKGDSYFFQGIGSSAFSYQEL